MADIEIGDAHIDDKLLIKSPNEYMVKDLLSKEKIKENLLAIKNINLYVEKKTYSYNFV